jgi:CHAT domain-containing protein
MEVKALLALANQYGAERTMSRWLKTNLQANEIASRVNDTDLIVASLRDIGLAYSDIGEQEQGIKAHYASVQRLYSGPVSLLRACQTYVHFARSLANYGRFQEARSYQLEALQYCRHCNPTVYMSAIGRAGKYAALAGEASESLHLFQQALTETEQYGQTAGTKLLAIELYLSLGDALVKNQRFSEAESAYYKAGEKLGEMNNRRYQTEIQHGLAVALLPQAKIREAEVALNKSIQLTESSRDNVSVATGRSAFVSSQLNVYQSMVEFQYFYKHSPELAFEFSEIYRNRELYDLLPHAQEIHWEEKRQDLKLETSRHLLTLSQIRQKLPADTQLIEYALTEKHLLVWVIDHERCLAESVPVTPAQLQAMVSAFSQAVRERRELTSLNAQARELYQLLIQPVAGHLKPRSNLVIVPDGALNSLPFAALVPPNSQRYLLEEYTLTISPSANILVELLARSQANRQKTIQSVLAVSDPEFDRRLFPKLSRLPGADEEIRELHSLYRVYEALPRAQATREAFLRRAKNFDVLHLATHSLVNANEPLLSAIVLAVEKREGAIQSESLLAAHEIFRLRLPRTRLVILSSCNSLVNQLTSHSGLGGLAHAFFSAGPPTVIGSLWEVNDESTASLMTAFTVIGDRQS